MARIIRLKNGLRLYLQPNKFTRSISIGVFVGAGCIYENKLNNGISHFIEHMNFKGTATRTAFDIADQMESIGVNINAYTTKSYTAFYTVGLDEYAEKCMDMLSDLYFNSTYDEENMEKEKNVIIEEINMYEDDGEDLCSENLSTAHFGRTKTVAYPILGTKKTVKSFTKKDIESFMQEFYCPENTVIAIAGHIGKEEAVALTEKYFDSKMEPTGFKRKNKGKNKPQSKYIEKIKPIEQANVAISFPAHSLKNDMSGAESILCNMLAGGMSSRLFQKVREELGLVYEIYASYMGYASDGYMYVFFATSPEQAEQAVAAVRQCLDEIKKNGFTEDELNKSKSQFKSGLVLSNESSLAIMRSGGKDAIVLNSAYSAARKLKEVDEVNSEQIKEAVEKDFIYELSSVSYVGQKQQKNLREVFLKAGN